MSTKSLIELIERLCQPGQRARTGIWLVPDGELGREEDILQRMSRTCDVIDLRQAVLKRRPAQTQYAGINPENIHKWLDDILETEVSTDCAVLLHFDLLLAYLPAPERERTLEILKISFIRRGKAMVIALPKRAVGLLFKEETAAAWQAEKRLVDDENERRKANEGML